MRVKRKHLALSSSTQHHHSALNINSIALLVTWGQNLSLWVYTVWISVDICVIQMHDLPMRGYQEARVCATWTRITACFSKPTLQLTPPASPRSFPGLAVDVHSQQTAQWEFLIRGSRQWISHASLAGDYFGIITPLHEHISEAWSVFLQNKYILSE